MSKLIDSSQITPTNGVYLLHRRGQEAVAAGTRAALGQDSARLIVAGGDSRGFGFTFHYETERALEEAAKSGALDRVASIGFAELTKQFQLLDEASAEFRFNSDEYVEANSDGYARWRDGDWRTDHVVTLNSKGVPGNHA